MNYSSWENVKAPILVVNCGSSSIKATLFAHDHGIFRRLCDAHLKGINAKEGQLEMTSSSGKEAHPFVQALTIADGLSFIFQTIAHQFDFSFSSLWGIGHRFVHGGERYWSSVRLDQTVILSLEKLSDLAPLHNESCLLGIKACHQLSASIAQVAVFDTAFHHFLPAVASHYAIPDEISSKYPIRRYGFHGISHAFLWEAYREMLGKQAEKAKVITLHLGNGCSMTAISGGQSIDTSMGFTPAEGLVMGTRAGDIDAAVMEFLCLHQKKAPSEVMEMLNFQSGLLGVSACSSDLETLLHLSQQNPKAKLAIEMFCYRILKYVGAYLAVLGGAEALIFSGGIGENAPSIRAQIIHQMEWYGVKLGSKANNEAVGLAPGQKRKISSEDSSLSVYVIASDENLWIAKDVARVLTPC